MKILAEPGNFPLKPPDRQIRLENSCLTAVFGDNGCSLQSLANKLTGETYGICGDTFVVEAAAFCVKQEDLRLLKRVAQSNAVKLEYVHPDVSVVIRYTLDQAHHFIQKHLLLTCPKAAALTRVSLGKLEFSGTGLQVVCCKHPDFDYYDDMPNHKMNNVKRPKDTEPVKTYFGRTARGGFFTGLEMPFDTSTAAENVVELCFAPSLRLKAGEEFACEPAYFGVYRRGNDDRRADQWRPTKPIKAAYGGFDGAAAAGLTSPAEIKGDSVLPRSCVVFGPIAQDAPRLAPEKLNIVPKTIEIGGRQIMGQSRRFNDHCELDLGDLLAPRRTPDDPTGLTAYVFLPFDVSKPGPLTFGLGADWWYETWLDGQMISETVSSGGNRSHPPDICDFTATVTVAAGHHVLALRFIRGQGSARLVVGGPADLRRGFERMKLAKENEAKNRERKAAATIDPLPAESAAMVAMTTAILGLNGKPRHGLKALACGWHCQMEHAEYSAESLAADLQALDTIKDCGLDGLTDSHPWGGETDKMNRLREDDRYELGGRQRRFLDRARELDLMVVMWPTMNQTHPWNCRSQPFRPDCPQWRRGVKGEASSALSAPPHQRLANCLAHEPFLDWLIGLNRQGLATGYYDGWCMDGDFWGTGAYYTTTVPVTCTADNHRHLPPDANFACQRALDRLIAEARKQQPDAYIVMCRPPMDLGVWSNRNVDACFTLIETGGSVSNLASGNEIRKVSRIRVHHHFFPHWLDWPLLFPSYGHGTARGLPSWPSEHIDYIMLSALSSSPNLLFYLPARTGIPEKDKAEIRKWLKWGRKNEKYLMVRKDLFDWPAPERVDGSAHILGDRGVVFLFNSGKRPLPGEFQLTEDGIGLKTNGILRVTQEYPPSNRAVEMVSGQTVRWEVPAQTAAIIRIQPNEISGEN